MYADDLDQQSNSRLVTLWHRDNINFIKSKLNVEKNRVPTTYHMFSTLFIAQVNRQNKQWIPYRGIGGITETEWLSGEFIKRLHLEGTNRIFAINNRCKLFKRPCPRELAYKKQSKITEYYIINNTVNGYVLVPIDMKVYRDTGEIKRIAYF